MTPSNELDVRSAEVVLACAELDDTLAFFTDRLGFRLEEIVAADHPTAAVVVGHGVRIRLQRGVPAEPANDRGERCQAGVLRLRCAGGPARTLVAPNGTRIEIVAHEEAAVLPPLRPSFVVSRLRAARWQTGRAGMRYRDLVPDRQGGRFIASHIAIPGAGAVADYVHFHRVALQIIYCVRGEARLVYEDQGPPFVLRAGDCVVQPPEIRHRVLASAGDLEVIEVTAPAEHATCADHDLALPTPEVRREREFGGQRFLHHVAAEAEWRPAYEPGWRSRDLGVAAATKGRAAARVLRSAGTPSVPPGRHDEDLLLRFVLAGALTLQAAGHPAERLQAGDAFVVPAGIEHALLACTADLELLEVASPARFPATAGATAPPLPLPGS
jgi:quercetin dioxygenase-like cupin family protein